jgi:hypothetical protein
MTLPTRVRPAACRTLIARCALVVLLFPITAKPVIAAKRTRRCPKPRPAAPQSGRQRGLISEARHGEPSRRGVQSFDVDCPSSTTERSAFRLSSTLNSATTGTPVLGSIAPGSTHRMSLRRRGLPTRLAHLPPRRFIREWAPLPICRSALLPRFACVMQMSRTVIGASHALFVIAEFAFALTPHFQPRVRLWPVRMHRHLTSFATGVRPS